MIDAHGGDELLRFDVGRAPQGLALSADGKTLYVNNFMDRTVGVFDLRRCSSAARPACRRVATLNAVGTEKLAADVLLGKQLFYDARDTRLARDRYMSCASCHNDGGHDGRVWDLTGLGEGLRNTISLRGRAGGQGLLHWSDNFDEVQDFEGQIRALAGGTGLMTDAAFNTGTRSQPLGDRRPASSADLDALAAYVASLNALRRQPVAPGGRAQRRPAGRPASGVPADRNCAACHGGAAFTGAARACRRTSARSSRRAASAWARPLTGIDVADAARRLGDRALPARRLGGDARRRGARARDSGDRRRRPRRARRLPARDRQRGTGRAGAATRRPARARPAATSPT